MRRSITAIPVVAAFAFSAAVFSRLPVSSHPDFSAALPIEFAQGEPLSRVAAALLLPTVALLVWALLTALAKVERGRKPLPGWWLNEQTGAVAVRRFEPTYATLTFAVVSLVVLMHVALLGSLLGWPAWSYRIFTALLGFGLIAAGNVMPRTRPNWIVGLRTKRTLSDPAVWLRTHRLLGALMVFSGSVVILASVVAPRHALASAVVLLLVSFVVAQVAGTRAKPPAGEITTGD